MTTPQPQATGEPQAEDVRAIDRLIAIVRRPYDVAGFDERVVAETANVDIAYNSGVGESDLAYVNVELEVIREAVFSFRDHAAAVEAERDRLLAFAKEVMVSAASYPPSIDDMLSVYDGMRREMMRLGILAKGLLAELADSATVGEDGER